MIVPVILTPELVTLNISVSFTKVFTSLLVPKFIYSWSVAVPIFKLLLQTEVIVVWSADKLNDKSYGSPSVPWLASVQLISIPFPSINLTSLLSVILTSVPSPSSNIKPSIIETFESSSLFFISKRFVLLFFFNTNLFAPVPKIISSATNFLRVLLLLLSTNSISPLLSVFKDVEPKWIVEPDKYKSLNW